MSELISREALRKAFHERIWHFDKSSWDEANALIDNAPTVTPQAFINGIVEIINKNGITTIDELLETLKGGAE